MNKEKEWRPLPDSITIRESKIEGLGVFATKDLPSETDLGISHVYDNRFPDNYICLLYTSPSPRDISGSRMPSSA